MLLTLTSKLGSVLYYKRSQSGWIMQPLTSSYFRLHNELAHPSCERLQFLKQWKDATYYSCSHMTKCYLLILMFLPQCNMFLHQMLPNTHVPTPKCYPILTLILKSTFSYLKNVHHPMESSITSIFQVEFVLLESTNSFLFHSNMKEFMVSSHIHIRNDIFST